MVLACVTGCCWQTPDLWAGTWLVTGYTAAADGAIVADKPAACTADNAALATGQSTPLAAKTKKKIITHQNVDMREAEENSIVTT